jgi:hypothetical protein
MTNAEPSALRFLSISSDAYKLANIRIAMNIASALLISSLAPLVVFAFLAWNLGGAVVWIFLYFFCAVYAPLLMILEHLKSFRQAALARISINLFAVNAIGGAVILFIRSVSMPGLWFIIHLAGFVISCYVITMLVNGVASVPPSFAPTWLRRTNDNHLTAITYPPGRRLAKISLKERTLHTFWSVLSALAFSLAICTAINTSGWTNVAKSFLILRVCVAGVSTSDCLSQHQGKAVFVFCLILAFAYLLMRLAHALRMRGLKLIRSTALRLMERDPRPPVVFLRSFATDQNRFASEHSDPLYNLCNLGKCPSNFDHLLLDEASAYGPVVAIGKPGTEPPILGVAREFVEDIAWQDVANNWMVMARRIVLVFGSTPGLNWEIERIKKLKLFSKTLTLVPPNTNVNDLWLKLDLPHHQMRPKESVIAVVGAGENAAVLTSRNPSYEAYKISVHAAFSHDLSQEIQG